MKAAVEVSAEHRERLRLVNERLNQFFGFPIWRNPLPAVDELVSTFLSQNTNDLNRDKAFEAIRQRYTSWDEVCEADPDEFMQVIRAAGLANQKGPNIQAALQRIRSERGVIDLEWLRGLPLEEAREWLLSFKGVGRKTAAIVLLFSLGMPAFPVDTHIYRVSGRIGLRPQAMDVDSTHQYLEAAADPGQYYALHLNLIRLGREICQARKPACARCPLVELCQYPDKVLS
ncbi:MAG TPA: endonuclease III [Anaerolineaceae bacterium]|nr:endonuclease III [Anaerolineaceae bacterium]HPS32566.1 endonuclease III [Anaerolineaceae bacterium]